MSVARHSEVLPGDLTALAELATLKNISGSPFAMTAPSFSVASQAEMLRLAQADYWTGLPGGYAVRTDINQVFRLTARPHTSLASWSATGIPVYTDANAMPVGTNGQIAALTGTVPPLWVWRNGSWRHANVKTLIQDIRGGCIATAQYKGLLAAPYQKLEKFGFYGVVETTGQHVNTILPLRQKSPFSKRDPTDFEADEFTFGRLNFGNVSYITSQPTTVRTKLRFAGRGRRVSDGRYAFKMRFKGQPSVGTGTLKMIYRFLLGGGRIGTPEGDNQPDFTFHGSIPVGYTQEIWFHDFDIQRSWFIHYIIDSPWNGEEINFEITTPRFANSQSNGTALDLSVGRNINPSPSLQFGILVADSAGSQAIQDVISSDGSLYVTDASGTPNISSDSEDNREGWRLQTTELSLVGWRPDQLPEYPWGPGDFSYWCESDVIGTWRATPAGPLPGYDAKIPEMWNRYAQFLPGSTHALSAIGTQGNIPRVPALKTTHTPNTFTVSVPLPVGTVLRELRVCRSNNLTPAERLALSVNIGYMKNGSFTSLDTLTIPAGQLCSDRIYPGWMFGGIMALTYVCTEAVSVSALVAKPKAYTVSGLDLRDGVFTTATISGPVSAFQYNDLESILARL